MKVLLENIKKNYKERRYEEVVRLTEQAEKDGFLCPEILLWKGRSLQLVNGETPYQLPDIENTFRQALDIDEDFTPAIIELAWFYLNVLDDAARAAQLFEKAINSQKQLLAEAVVGKAKCLMETETRQAAKRYLAEISTSCLENTELERAIDDLASVSE